MPTSSRPALTGLSLTMLMATLDTSIANAALPALARAFDAPFESVRWVVLGYLLTLTAFTVLAGRVGDRFGRRRTLLAATLVFTLASSLCSMAPTLSMLIAARAAQGLGAAAMTALSLACIHEIVPASATGRAIGFLGTMSAIGTTLGPSLGGLLTERFGWEAIFLVNVPLGVFALLIGFLHLPAHPSAATQSPRFDPDVLRRRTATTALAANGLVSTVMMTTLVVGPFYLSRALGLSDGAVGLALSLGPLVAALSGMPAGWLIDRYGAERMTMSGLVGLATATSIVGVLPRGAGVAGYLLALSGMTAAYAVFQAANNTHLMATTDARSRGAAAGLIGLTRNLGLIAGASVMGAVFVWGVGPSGVTDAPPDVVAAGVRTTFRIAALLIGVAIAAVMFSRTVRRPPINHSSAVSQFPRSQAIVLALLVLVSVVPVAAGIVRLAELWGAPVVTAMNARFVARPWPVVLHILSVIPYSLLGALQFVPAFRRYLGAWHRKVGAILLVCGLASALTGLWMSHFYPWPPLDGTALYVERLVFGTAMVASLVLGTASVRQRDFAAHGRWMIRAYAIGMGAGTQVLTHAPWLVLGVELTETSRAVAMGAGWVINVFVAEAVIYRAGAT